MLHKLTLIWSSLVILLLAGCVPIQAPVGQGSNTAWKLYQADSGFAIQYPLDVYSMRNGLASPDVIFPGAKVLEPNDSFTFREPLAVTYKLSLVASRNIDNLSLDDPKQLLAHSEFIAYNVSLLKNHPIQSITLDGEKAFRVDNLPIGPAGITTQIVTIHNEFIYELMIEPYQLIGNQAEPAGKVPVTKANLALVEQIMATFKFVDDDAPVVSATPTPSRASTPGPITPAQRAAIQTLADSLKIGLDQIKVVTSVAVQWPNGCLGVTRVGVMCTQAIVPGFRIVLAANGQPYEFHTNADGTTVVPSTTGPVISNDAAQKAALAALASELKIAATSIKVISTASVEWPDSCLGIFQQGVTCAQGKVPGYLFMLEAQGKQYEVHTNQDASVVKTMK